MRKDYGDSSEMKSSLPNESQNHPQDQKKKKVIQRVECEVSAHYLFQL